MTSKDGRPRYPLLAPTYYCLITPASYAALSVSGMSAEHAEEAGYFFPPLESTGSAFNADRFCIFTKIDPGAIS